MVQKILFVAAVITSIVAMETAAPADVPQFISFQGKLYDNAGHPVSGQKSITFRLYTVESGGTHVWSETKTVTCDNGLYSVILGQVTPIDLDFDGQYWLGVQVAGDSELSPRYRLVSVPTAFMAQDANGVNGIPASTTPIANHLFPLGADAKFPASVLPSNPPPGPHATTHNEGGSDVVTVTSSLIQNGTVSTLDLADNAVTTAKIQPDVVSSIEGVANDGGNVDLVAGSNISITPNDAANTITIAATAPGSDAWKLTGNAGTNPAMNFLGTTDNQSLELRVNGSRALRLEPHSTSPNIIGGFGGNSVTGGKYGATIGGGGGSGVANTVTENYGTIGGGEQNTAGGEMATVSGGSDNAASGRSAVVGGGTGHSASTEYATVGGGYSNEVYGTYGTIGGGQDNDIYSGASHAIVGGGRYNSAAYQYATVGGGFSNSAGASYATISGGGRSSPGDPSTGNRVTDDYGTIGGGGNNQAGDFDGDPSNEKFATVGGGEENKASGASSTVGGGRLNIASVYWSTIGGGYGNKASKYATTIAGGDMNEASGDLAAIGGGYGNEASGGVASIGGGNINEASGHYATVPGGFINKAKGDYSLAAGRYAIADGNGSFVWGDSNDKEIHAWGANQFVIRATGGFWFITKVDETGYPIEGMQLPANSSHWVPIGSSTVQRSQEQSDRIQKLELENTSLKQSMEQLEKRLEALEERAR